MAPKARYAMRQLAVFVTITCLLASLAVIVVGWNSCPSLLAFVIIAMPQVAIFAGCGALSWRVQPSPWASVTLLTATALVAWLAYLTTRAYVWAFESDDPHSTYGLAIILFWSLVIQAWGMALIAWIVSVLFARPLGCETKAMRSIATGFVALPPLVFCVASVVEFVGRTLTQS